MVDQQSIYDTMSTLGWAMLGITVVALCWAVWYAWGVQRKYRKKKEKDEVASVNAGDRKDQDVGATIATDALRTLTFTDKDGSVINPDDFEKYIVVGSSMKYCGISDRDLIFVTKGVNMEDLKDFPKPIVLRWDNAGPDSPQFKLRRGWATWIPCADGADTVLQSIFSNPAFDQIRRIPGYDGDEVLARDFKEERLPRYMARYASAGGACSLDDGVLISTTWHVAENKVRFSIHRLSSLVGVVKASFDVD